MSKAFDLIIVGGGLVGSGLAHALSKTPLRIALIEALAKDIRLTQDFDTRTIGLNYHSRKIFEGMELWQAIAPHATPIEHIHISDRGHFAKTHLSASRFNIPAFGYVVPMPHLIKTLTDTLHSCMLYCPAKVVAMEASATQATVTLDSGDELSAPLIVAADGSYSQCRKLAGIAHTVKDYQQSAIICNGQFSKAQQGRAYERFTATGPLAVLPLPKALSGMVWTVPSSSVDDIKKYSDLEFIEAIQERFGYRLGSLTQVGKRFVYPLKLVRANRLSADRVLLIGNAANTIHPIGAQGLNLGLRDVEALARLIKSSVADIGAAAMLTEYARLRASDHKAIVNSSDYLVRLFSTDFMPMVVARSLGLQCCDMFSRLKSKVAARAMGEPL